MEIKLQNFNTPSHISRCNTTGLLYITDQNNHRVQVLSEVNGEHIFSFGQLGKEASEFEFPRGIAVSRNSNKVFVADGRRIQMFSKNGNFLLSFGDGLLYPYGACVDKVDNIFIADRNGHSIKVFDGNGNFLLQFGGYGSKQMQMRFPIDVDVDKEGNLCVCD
eukprot:TRINITY_DN14505_c0_g1_i1.p1 TRINITY_DN14505_c0_g1~~TRINITY_DN14505_c0_g1_i1.p1  ORF type:complete len:163 (-),score=30.53 TRINITY_DN14505_c0_g1_i1:63-551(-)